MNNIKDVLQYADDLIFKKTGENLTPIQEAILTGTYQGKNNFEIAQDFHCSESHIKKEAAKLWKKLGKELGENVNKYNVRSKLEKKQKFSQVCYSGDCLLQQIDLNIYTQIIQTINNSERRSPSKQPQKKETIIDLTDAPELTCNYGRKLEISTLKEWIENNTRLITIYGLSGIGKTALGLKLISEINTEFNYIIYRSLDNLPKLITLKNELKNFFSQSQSNLLPEVINYFKSFRCLVILDDVQNIFKSGELAGQYLHEYQDYRKFFEQVTTKYHQSCLILISQEKSGDLEILESKNQLIKTLHIQGLDEDSKEILREKRLKDEEKWDKLITLYQGNPTYLNIIADTISEFYDGKVAQFLTEENELFLDDITVFLETYLERLSDLEIKVINWLVTQDKAIDIEQKPANIEVSNYELLTAIKSLIRRCLVEKVITEKGNNFQLNSLLKNILIKQLKS